MSRLATSFVRGYHGCDKSVADRVIASETDLVQSDTNYDWLGPGAYFWEGDPRRALEWAQWRASRKEITHPAVVGAVIDLRNCLDLSKREDLELLATAHSAFSLQRSLAGLPMPENKSVPGSPDEDRVLRFLDCAVIRYLHDIIDQTPANKRKLAPFDSVRGMFTEGDRAFPGSGFWEKSHVQIAVRNNACILGLFHPRPQPRLD